VSFWDKNITLFRVIIALLFLVLLIIDITNFIRVAKIKTDENLYSDNPTRFYVTNDIHANLTDNDNLTKKSGVIKTGNLIYKINDTIPKDVNQLYQLIKNDPNDVINIVYVDNKDINKDFNRFGFFKFKSAQINKKDIPQDFITFLNSAVFIGYVEPNGTSQRAGIQVGDYIIKVNGESFSSALEANEYILEGESGSYLSYDILRDNKLFECRVEIVKYQIPLNFLCLFIIGLVNLLLGVVLAELRPGLKSGRLLGLAFVVMGYFLSSFLIPVRIGPLFQYHIYFLFALATAFAFPLFINGLVYFPRDRKDISSSRWVVLSPYIYGIVFIILAILNLFAFKSMTIDTILLRVSQFSIPAFLLYYFIILMLYRKSRSKEEAGLSKMINFTFLFILLFSLAVIVLSLFKINFLNSYFQYSLILIPFAFIYTIGRYKLLNLEFRIRKNIQFILISILWKVVLLTMIFGSILFLSTSNFDIPNLHFTGSTIEVLDHPLTLSQHTAYYNSIIMFLSVCGVIIFRIINRFGQNFLNKKYFRTGFDYRKAATDFSEILDRNISINDLAQNIVSELAELVHLRKAGIVFYKSESILIAQNFFGFQGESVYEYCKVTALQQITYIKKFKSEFRVDYLDEPMKEIYNKCEFRYIVPIRSKEKIVGALMVGDKMSEAPYNREDLDFLNAIAGQISTAVENAFLYEDLTQQERIKHELNLARKIQLASLPQSIPDINGLDVSGISIPAHEVGGDFYDYLGRNGELTVIVGDVSGKGTSAAMYMSKAQGIMRTLHEFNLSPKELFIRSNSLLYKYLEKSSFITAICAIINTAN
jgi:phosphoserine phosphatase RsbU/P